MGERSYLAIGDVLALLREEFPDVTISKIRFLESRGLLDPERTPSGYRKFYESDVDRLRWILRQQREHFLPLKVIKGRLENGMTDPDAPTPHLFEMGDPPPEREAQAVLVGAGQLTEQRAQAALAAVTPIAAATGAADRLASRSGQSMMSKGQAAPTSARAVESGPSGSERAETHETPEAAVGGSPEPHQGAPATESPRRRRASSASSLPPAVPEGAKETGPATRRAHQRTLRPQVGPERELRTSGRRRHRQASRAPLLAREPTRKMPPRFVGARRARQRAYPAPDCPGRALLFPSSPTRAVSRSPLSKSSRASASSPGAP